MRTENDVANVTVAFRLWLKIVRFSTEANWADMMEACFCIEISHHQYGNTVVKSLWFSS